MVGVTTWWHGPALLEAITAAGLHVEARYADLTGAPHDPDHELEVLVLTRPDPA